MEVSLFALLSVVEATVLAMWEVESLTFRTWLMTFRPLPNRWYLHFQSIHYQLLRRVYFESPRARFQLNLFL